MFNTYKQYKILFTKLLISQFNWWPEWPSENIDKETQAKESAEKDWEELANALPNNNEETETSQAIDKQASNLADQANENINWISENNEKNESNIWKNMDKVVQYIIDNWGKWYIMSNLHTVISENNDIFNFPQDIVDAFEWCLQSGKDQKTLWLYFEEQWYFFNWNIDSQWGDLLIKLWDKKEVGWNNWNVKLFWTDNIKWYHYYEIDDPDFHLSWNSFWWVAVLNIPRNVSTYNETKNETNPDSDFSKSIEASDYWESMANNEIAHEILKNQYEFDNDTIYNWESVDSWVDWYSIPDSQQVHEFMSDVASLNTSIADTSRIVNNLLYWSEIELINWNLKISWLNEAWKAWAPWYDYTNRFMAEKINNLISDKWMKVSDLWSDLASIKANIINTLDNSDYKNIQNSYLDQWKILLNEIKSINS